MSIIELTSTALAGNLLGAVGAAVSRWQQSRTDLQRMELQHTHELALADIELRQAKVMAKATIVRSDADIQGASYEADSAIGERAEVGSFVANVRALVRPLLTAFLVLCVAIIGLSVASSAELPSDTEAQLLLQIVDGLVGCTSMALAWWFGARSNR